MVIALQFNQCHIGTFFREIAAMITLYLDVTIFTEHLPPKLFYAFYGEWQQKSDVFPIYFGR